MSDFFNPKPAKTKVGSTFANPKLAEIAESFEVRRGRGFWYSVLNESYAVLAILFGALLLVPCLSIAVALPFMVLRTVFFGIFTENHLFFSLLFATLLMYYISYTITAKYFFRLRRAAKMGRIDALAKLSKRAEDPVLYLRSFAHDAAENPYSRAQKTYEENLALALSSIGPVIAVGNPLEIEPPPGAARIYLKNEHWQENVRRLMQISQLIIIQAGTTQGVIWELEAALETGEPRKVIMSFLSWMHLDEAERERQYLQFCRNVHNFLQQSSSPVTIWLPGKIENAAFVVFSDVWMPEMIKITRGQKLLYRFSSSLLVTEAIRPVLAKRGLKLSLWKNVLYFIFLFWAVFGTLWSTLRLLKIFSFAESGFVQRLNGLFGIAFVLVIIWLIPNIFLFIYNQLTNLFRRLKAGRQEAK